MNRRPALVLVGGPGKTADAVADEAALEALVIRDEARAHVRRMRLCLQGRFWSDPEFAVLAKPIREAVESFARKLADDEGRAA